MIEAFHTLAEALDQTSIGQAIAGSRLAYPLLEGSHLIAISLAFGLIFLTDLRMLGLFLPQVPFESMHRQLRPYIGGGMIVVFITGMLLVFAESSVMFAPSFPVKMSLIVLGGINALYFELVTDRRAGGRAVLPVSARAAAWISMVVWTLVIVAGRLIAYVPTWSSWA